MHASKLVKFLVENGADQLAFNVLNSFFASSASCIYRLGLVSEKLMAMMKSRGKEIEYARQSLCGNSFSVPTAAWLLAHLAQEWGLLQRAPCMRVILSSLNEERALVRGLAAETSPQQETTCAVAPVRGGLDLEQLLALSYIRGADHRGSDVRLDTGEQACPSQWPRCLPCSLSSPCVAVHACWQRAYAMPDTRPSTTRTRPNGRPPRRWIGRQLVR